MRRSGQPSLPSAMTCCFFDSFNTLLMPTQPTRLHRDSMSGTSLPLAGFQVIIIGRFWVITEADNRDPPGFKSRGHGESDLAALLSRTTRKQLPVFRSTAGVRTLPAYLHARVYTGRWYLTVSTLVSRFINSCTTLVIDVLGFDFQILLTGFANPVVFSFDEGVVVYT